MRIIVLILIYIFHLLLDIFSFSHSITHSLFETTPSWYFSTPCYHHHHHQVAHINSWGGTNTGTIR